MSSPPKLLSSKLRKFCGIWSIKDTAIRPSKKEAIEEGRYIQCPDPEPSGSSADHSVQLLKAFCVLQVTTSSHSMLPLIKSDWK